jgi:ABC-type transporter Mla subunit MlaD
MNQKLSLNRAIISDILLWIALTLLVAYGIYFIAVVMPNKRGQTISLHFRDANEISKGSAVRMMGMDIGFVDNLHIRKDHVEIVVQTYPNALEIPSGSTFTILFTGLAGAKSIEVELPDTPQPLVGGKPLYLIEEPIRMKDTLNSQIEVTQALQKGAENIADFFGKKKPVEELQFNIQQTHQASIDAIQNLNGMNQAIRHISQEITENALSAIDTLSGLNRGSRNIVSMTQPEKLRGQVSQVLQTTQKLGRLFRAEATTTIQTITLQERLAQFNQINSQVSNRMQSLQQRVKDFPLTEWLQRIDTYQGGFADFVNKAHAFFATDRLPALKHARQSIQAFNCQLEALNTRIDARQKQPPKKQQKK